MRTRLLTGLVIGWAFSVVAAAPTWIEVPWVVDAWNPTNYTRTNLPAWWDGGSNFYGWTGGTNTALGVAPWMAWQAVNENFRRASNLISAQVTTQITAITGSVITNGHSAMVTFSNAVRIVGGNLSVPNLANFATWFANGLNQAYQDADNNSQFALGAGSPGSTDYSGSVGVGQGALLSSPGSDNVALGRAALSYSPGNYNSAVGVGSILTSYGNNNSALGWAAGAGTAGDNNSSLGWSALNSSSGNFNTAIGMAAIQNSPGNYNSALGASTLFHVIGSSNTAIGFAAGNHNTNGDGNLYLGTHAGPATGRSESGQLYLANAHGKPLIGGDFTAKTVHINGTLSAEEISLTGMSSDLTVGGIISGNGSGLTNLPSQAFYGGTTGGQTIAANTTIYYLPNNSASNQVTIDTSAVTRCPVPRAVTLKNLYVVASTAPGGAYTDTITITTNGTASDLVATISASETTGNDTAHQVRIVAGVEIGVQINLPPSATASRFSWGFEAN